jgi:NAD(P)-dependent dehydrogenase (short-subunit alcohol dehydrogenase family)
MRREKQEGRDEALHGCKSRVTGAGLESRNPGHYVASRHAVLGLTKTAAVEYGRYGIRVNAVSPGAVRIEMFREGKIKSEESRRSPRAPLLLEPSSP